MVLGVDIGGTSVKLGLVTEQGEIIARDEASVSYDHYETPILTSVIRACKAFLAREKAEITGIGVSATGQVDDRTGVVIGTNGKIPHYEGARIREEMEAEFAVPVRVLNDANAAVLGECWLGAAKQASDVLMLTLGTGVGGGVVTGGQLLRGAKGIAGELGHFTIYQNGIPCPCGKRGCLESYAATTALVRLAQEVTGEQGLDGRVIFSRAAAGDQTMLNILSNWIDDIAAGITGLVHIFNPELILIGGGVSAQEQLLIDPLREKVLKGVMPRFAEGLQLKPAALTNDAGLLGAVRFLMDQG